MRFHAPWTKTVEHLLKPRTSRTPYATIPTTITRRKKSLFRRRTEVDQSEQPEAPLTIIVRGLLDDMPAKKRAAAPFASDVDPKKRRTTPKPPKWYGVRVGKTPGVYDSWDACRLQINGIKDASFKGFLTEEDARAFVARKPIPNSEPKYYAIARGLFTGIFTDWDTCKEATKTKGPKYKRFDTLAEAIAFIEEWGDKDTIAKVRGEKPSKAKSATKKEPTKKEPIKKEPINQPDLVQIYTDGSSLGNGKEDSAAGVGVFFGPNDPRPSVGYRAHALTTKSRNVSERLLGKPQTNQRAELTAILRALQNTPITRPVLILTDSQYSINCVEKWYVAWGNNNWRTTTGETVKNKDLVQAIRKKIDERTAAGASTNFKWVKGHANSPGNVAADRLAVAGAMKPLPAMGRTKLKTELD